MAMPSADDWPRTAMSDYKVRVRRSKWGKAGRRPRHYWRVEQRTTPWNVRVFTYSNYRWAKKAAVALAYRRPISTFGLRGFHFEGEQP